MKIELSGEQERAAQQGQPVEVVDPQTQRAYLLIAREAYQGSRGASASAAPAPVREEATGIPAGIRRAQEAFWRDLPQLLAQKKLRGRWALYQGEERVGVARTERELIREALRRGLREDEYYTDLIEPRACAPWEVEEIAPQRWPGDEEGPPPAAASIS